MIKIFKKWFRRSKIMIFYNKINRLKLSVLSKVKYSDILQLSNITEYNRHPDLFCKAQNNLGKENDINILSFGCSTGEECFSMREYFPFSNIFGIDISDKSLNEAKENNNDSRIQFYKTNKFTPPVSSFNLILANSVLCKQPEDRILENISSLFSFNKFNEIIEYLDSMLLINGLLIIRYSNYNFEDTEISRKYECISSIENNFPLFDKKGDKIHKNQSKSEIFRKIKK